MSQIRLVCRAAVFAALFGLGCGATAPSPELVSARDAYADAESSPAKTLVPDRLLEAQQALDVAEREFDEEGNSAWARALAYVADRKARLAVAMAEIAAARSEREKVEEDYKLRLEIAQRNTRARLGDTKDSLEDAQRELTDKQRELAERERLLAEREAELAKERQARIEAEEKAAAAVASLEEIAAIKEDKRGTVITFSGAVLFKTGESSLLPIAQQQLGKVAAALVEQAEDRTITIEGHTDSRGSAARNQTLSLARAQSVRAYLVSQGVEPTRIVAVGKGETQPIADNRTAEGRANNRRVEIIINNPSS